MRKLNETREPLLTPEEVSAYLGVPVQTLTTWRSRGTGPTSIKVGRHRRYRRDDVEQWLERRASTAARGGEYPPEVIELLDAADACIPYMDQAEVVPERERARLLNALYIFGRAVLRPDPDLGGDYAAEWKDGEAPNES